MRKKLPLVLALVLMPMVALQCRAGAPSAAPAGADPLLRLHLSPGATDADLLRIRDNLASYGGSVKGLAPGNVLVVRVPSQAVPVLQGLHGVGKVVAVPASSAATGAAARTELQALTPAQRSALLPRACLATPDAAQKARAEAFMKLAPLPAANDLSRRRALLAGQSALPSAVDNSLSQHFPPIGDQAWTRTCGVWSAGYYWSTYTQAMDEGLDVSGEWLPRDPPCDIFTDGKFDGTKFSACLLTVKDPPRPSRATEHIASPAFLYPLVRAWSTIFGAPNEDGGVYMPDVMAALARWGIGSWKMKSFDPWVVDNFVFTWPTEAQWVEALPRRTAQPVFVPVHEPGQIDALKQHLANGNLAVIDFLQTASILDWGFDRACEGRTVDPCPGISNGVLYANPGIIEGAHGVTAVGYDDDREYFDDALQQTRRGAFLIANSAGPEYGLPNTAGGPGRGFFWMSYDFVRSSNVRLVAYNVDRPRYRPRLYAAAAVESANRTNGTLFAHVGFQGLDFVDQANFLVWDSGNWQPHPGEWAPRPLEVGKRLVIDMTDALPRIDLSAPMPLLAVGSILPSGGTLGTVDFYLDRLGNGSFLRMPSPDTTRSARPGSVGVVACNNVVQRGDVTQDGSIDRIDVKVISSTTTWPAQCVSDPRDLDRDGRVTVIDARRAALNCTRPGCAPR